MSLPETSKWALTPSANSSGRTLHSRFLLRLAPELNDLIVGILGRAQRLYEVRLCAFAFLSNVAAGWPGEDLSSTLQWKREVGTNSVLFLKILREIVLKFL